MPPYSQSVELGSQMELRCHPPSGKPKPRVRKTVCERDVWKSIGNPFRNSVVSFQIYWLKDRVEVQPGRDPNYIQASAGHLIIIQAREEDRANYTCVAENVANRRLSPAARLSVVGEDG